MNQETIEYIIRFLTGTTPDADTFRIGYTSNREDFDRFDLVFIPSGFFNKGIYGTKQSLPVLPLREIEGIPILFGDDKVEQINSTLVVHADLIASTYFLITRYEEFIVRDSRDANGRFPGKQSLPYRAGFIHRPIVDEYRLLIRTWLKAKDNNLPSLPQGIRKVYLTHDVDAPFLYRSWKGFVRSLLARRGLVTTWRNKFGAMEEDPYFTFPWLLEKDQRMVNALGRDKSEIIFFVKGGGKVRQDKPIYNLYGNDMQDLFELFRSYQATIGMHTSYYAGLHPEMITEEKENLILALGQSVTCNRHHFLDTREPEDMDYLAETGITDDFTLGYADVAGFRLGTCYPVRWINPANGKLSELVLHPLNIMDCSLDSSAYMGLNLEEAKEYCIRLINGIHHVGGELVLLWHNTSFTTHTNNYHRELYTHLLNILSR